MCASRQPASCWRNLLMFAGLLNPAGPSSTGPSSTNTTTGAASLGCVRRLNWLSRSRPDRRLKSRRPLTFARQPPIERGAQGQRAPSAFVRWSTRPREPDRLGLDNGAVFWHGFVCFLICYSKQPRRTRQNIRWWQKLWHYGAGHVRNVTCRAHKNTDALLNPVTKPPSAPRTAQNVTMIVMNF